MANEYTVNQADLTSVADAIRTKGGTSAQLEFPSGFVSAIQNIQSGVTVQTNSGTVTTNSNSTAKSVSCGFKPDVVFLTLNQREDNYTYDASIDFNSSGATSSMLGLLSSESDYLLYTLEVKQTSSGFTITSYGYKGDWSGGYRQKTITYKAVKYTA